MEKCKNTWGPAIPWVIREPTPITLQPANLGEGHGGGSDPEVSAGSRRRRPQRSLPQWRARGRDFFLFSGRSTTGVSCFLGTLKRGFLFFCWFSFKTDKMGWMSLFFCFWVFLQNRQIFRCPPENDTAVLEPWFSNCKSGVAIGRVE